MKLKNILSCLFLLVNVAFFGQIAQTSDTLKIMKDFRAKRDSLLKKAADTSATTISAAEKKAAEIDAKGKRDNRIFDSTEKSKARILIKQGKLVEAAAILKAAEAMIAKRIKADSLEMVKAIDIAKEVVIKIMAKANEDINFENQKALSAIDKLRKAIVVAPEKYTIYDGEDFFDKLFDDYSEDLKKYIKNVPDTILKKKIAIVVRDTSHLFTIDIIYDFSLKQIKLNSTYEGKLLEGAVKKGYHVKNDYGNIFTTLLLASNKEQTQLNGVESLPLVNSQNIMTITIEQPMSKHRYNDKLRYAKFNNRWFIGAAITPGFNYRQVSMSDPQLESASELTSRNVNETARLTYAFSGYAGYAKGSHRIALNYTAQEFGFDYKNNSSINWETGTNDTIIKDRELQQVNSVGFSYTYANFYKKISPAVTAGMYCSFNTKKGPSDMSDNRNNYFATGIKAGLGINIHPCYAFEVRLMPVCYYNLNSTQGTMLNTRFYTYGFETGVYFNFSCLK